MVKRTAFGKGPTGPSPDELEREAASELRRAMAGSEPRPQEQGRRMRPERRPPEPGPEAEAESEEELEDFDGVVPEWMPGLTAEEERRAITDLAMRQLTERPSGNIRPEDTLLSANSMNDAENMRNKALADFMVRQQQMAKDRPAPATAPGRSARGDRGGPAVVQTTSGWTISPNLTTRPTMTGGPSGFSPELEAQAGMSRLKVDRNSRQSLAPGAARERPLRAGDGRSGREEAVGAHRPVKPGRNGAPGSKVRAVPDEEAASASPAGPTPSPAVRNRPVSRRAAPRVAATTESDARWRVLAELADLLAEEVFPGDALPEMCRWLAGAVQATVAIVLLADDAIDDVSAWPADDPLVEYVRDLVGEPLDEQSTIWVAVGEGRTIAGGPGDEPLVLPDGAGHLDLGGWAVVPVIDRTVAFGAMVVARPHGDGLPKATVSLIEEVAQRVARALLNCEEAASNGDAAEPEDRAAGDSSGDHQVPGPMRDRLGALSFVLSAIEPPPARPRLQPDQNRRYAEIVAHAAALQSEVTEFLHGQGDPGR